MNHETLKALSAGACKLYLAMTENPTVDRRDLGYYTGYSERQIRTLYKELMQAGLIGAQPPPPNELDEMLISRLVVFGFDRVEATRIARKFPSHAIDAVIRYVSEERGVVNPPGLFLHVIDRIKGDPALLPEKWQYPTYSNRDDEQYAAYGSLWHAPNENG